MTFAGVKEIFRALNDAEARYLVAGGLAVVAHGYVRLTVDIDLALDLEKRNLSKTLTALSALGFQPRVPVEIMEFADPAKRAAWVDEKGMMVFQVVSDRFPGNSVDLFAVMPFDFEEEYAQAAWIPIDGDLSVPVVQIDTLIAMKRKAGRDRDVMDIEHLERIRQLQDEGTSDT